MKWYEQNAGNGTQGMVVEEDTGRTVAVSYDRKDTKLLAAAPDLLEACEGLLSALEEMMPRFKGFRGNETVNTARAAVNKARIGG